MRLYVSLKVGLYRAFWSKKQQYSHGKSETALHAGKDRAYYKQWVESCLSAGDDFRGGKWTESIAVGSEAFIQNVKVLRGGMALGRKVLEAEESFQLKEAQYPYSAHFEAKKSDMGT